MRELRKRLKGCKDYPKAMRLIQEARTILATKDLWNEPQSNCLSCHGYPGYSICCLFCYCPYYYTQCEGNWKTTNGIKDCSDCVIPHTPSFVFDQFELLYNKGVDKP